MDRVLILFLTAFLFCLSACENGDNQIKVSTEIIEFKEAPSMFINRYYYGLNGQHSKMIISDRRLRISDSTTSSYPTFLSGSPIYILDTFPKPIIYYTVKPYHLNIDEDHNFDWHKVTGSQKYYLGSRKSDKLIKLSF